MASRPNGNRQVQANENAENNNNNDNQETNNRPERASDMKIISKNDLKRISAVHNIPLHIDQVHDVLNNFVTEYIARKFDSAMKIATNAGDTTLYATHL